VRDLVAVTYRRQGDAHRPSDLEPWTFCELTRVPCVNEFVDLGKEGTWRVLQVLHGRESRATIWIERADATDPWSPAR
jgi:hypothetical protein